MVISSLWWRGWVTRRLKGSQNIICQDKVLKLPVCEDRRLATRPEDWSFEFLSVHIRLTEMKNPFENSPTVTEAQKDWPMVF